MSWDGDIGTWCRGWGGDEEVCSWSGMSNDQAGACCDIRDTRTPVLLRDQDSGLWTIGLTLWHVREMCPPPWESGYTRPVTPYLYFIFLTECWCWCPPPWSPHVVTRLWSRPSCVLSVVTPAPALHCLSCLSETWKSKFEKQILKIILFIFQSFKKQTVRLHHWRIYKVKFNLLKHFIFNFHK